MVPVRRVVGGYAGCWPEIFVGGDVKENKKNILRTGWTNPAMFFAYPADIRKVFPTDESVKKRCGWQSRPRPEMNNAVE